MKWIICTKVEEQVGQSMTGPFDCYRDAMDHFVTMKPAAYDHKYIVELYGVAERAQIDYEGD